MGGSLAQGFGALKNVGQAWSREYPDPGHWSQKKINPPDSKLTQNTHIYNMSPDFHIVFRFSPIHLSCHFYHHYLVSFYIVMFCVGYEERRRNGFLK